MSIKNKVLKMTEEKVSDKLNFDVFVNELETIPLDVYYQTITSNQYTSNNIQFKIQAPVPGRSLLDADVFVKYKIRLYETAADSITRNLQYRAVQNDANLGNLVSTPVLNQNDRFAFRQGNVMQRCMSNLMITINNQSINFYPHKFIDVWNRLHISNDQSEHEFSASGGRFDEGNHGHRTSHIDYRNRLTAIGGAAPAHYRAGRLPITYGIRTDYALNLDTGRAFPGTLSLAADPAGFPRVEAILYDSYYSELQPDLALSNLNLYCQMRPPFPVKYEFYNPGFDARVNKMIEKMRIQTDNMNSQFTGGVDNFIQFVGESTAAGANQKVFLFEIFERLPCTLFKMYSNEQNRCIPNIRDMQIQINWLSTMVENLIHSNNNALGVDVYWAGITSNDAELYLRWYTPPLKISIPLEITIPYTHLDIQSFTLISAVPNNAIRYTESTFSQYNISLQAVPDLLLIYAKLPSENYDMAVPDDYNLEITSLILDIDSSSGKLNQIQTFDLYKKWKENLKHRDSKIIGYDEWRKYCCVAILKPDDIGLSYGSGYSKLCTIGVKCTFRNWWNNPAIMYQANEPLGDVAGANIECQVQILAVYHKYKLTLGSNGVGKLELQRLGDNIQSLITPSMISDQASPMYQRRLEY